jgi:hypothetical protein
MVADIGMLGTDFMYDSVGVLGILGQKNLIRNYLSITWAARKEFNILPPT